jgi:aarF domain-containing kinase
LLKGQYFLQVTDDLSRMSQQYTFEIPPYFALILRAFSVLEGIGLNNDPNYAIVDQCYPYISKRLITDDR